MVEIRSHWTGGLIQSLDLEVRRKEVTYSTVVNVESLPFKEGES